MKLTSEFSWKKLVWFLTALVAFFTALVMIATSINLFIAGLIFYGIFAVLSAGINVYVAFRCYKDYNAWDLSNKTGKKL